MHVSQHKIQKITSYNYYIKSVNNIHAFLEAGGSS